MTKQEIVNTLIETRINGNSIKGNTTYENMLKRVTKLDILNYQTNFTDYMYVNPNRTKLGLIEDIRDYFDRR